MCIITTLLASLVWPIDLILVGRKKVLEGGRYVYYDLWNIKERKRNEYLPQNTNYIQKRPGDQV